MTKQDRILSTLTEIMQDETKCEALENFLRLIQDNSLQNSLNELETIQQKKAEIENRQKEIGEILADTKISQQHIDEIYYKIYDIDNGENKRNSSQALIDIQDAQDKAQKLQQSYQQFYDTKDSQNNTTQGIITKLQEACRQIKENKDNIAEFSEFYNTIFEGKKNEKGEITTPALNDFLENKKQELDDLLKTKEKELDMLYDEKNQILTGLYDPTTAEGLTKAYKAEKIEIQKNIKWWNCIFAISIVIFLSAFGIYFCWSLNKTFDYVDFLRALPFWIFSGFFTFYSTKQIAEYKRIASEYAHKEALNKTYIGYKNQIEEAENDELKQELLKIMLDSAKLNPSETLSSKGEIPSITLAKETKDKVSENMAK